MLLSICLVAVVHQTPHHDNELLFDILLSCSREIGDCLCLLVLCVMRVTVLLTSVLSVVLQYLVSVCQLSVAVV